MKTTINLNDAALALAAQHFGTISVTDTVNAALVYVAERRRRIDRLAADRPGYGSEFTRSW
ncbi:type II toxin-antitoxin system VapB family antitoxin [Nocardia mexicana]|uniref:VapB protein of antitoxin of type II toxin-antitoxin system n=1 Tax=Nocardia mexicana TaxID=279262 RepID=A0A370H6K3_9NOCA|nr:type II toxin-antitoxin system VapB family antitoxin [Nocardia mexicana]RDI51575.1 VapB protein of antitoxin of type II toxin-antitoxin system [Nocardia mexicana]